MSSSVFKTAVAEVYEVAGSSISSSSPESRRPLTAAERCLVWLSVLATVYTLYAARSLLLPIAIAITIALLLRPLVGWMAKAVPQGLAALAALLVAAAFVVVVIYPIVRQIDALNLNDEATLREYASEAKTRFEPFLSVYEKIQRTADDLESSSMEVAPPDETTIEVSSVDDSADADEYAFDGGVVAEVQTNASPEDGPETVVNVPRSVVKDQQPLVNSALGIGASLVANTLLVVILLYFLLAAGDELIENIIRMTPGVQEKKRMGQLVKKVEKGVSQYLSTITAINAGLGVTVGTAMWLLGMPAPWLIGFMAFAFNFVPYVGAIAGMSIAAVVSVLVFDAESVGIFGFSGQAMWAIVPATYFLLTNIEGNLVTPTLLGQTMSLNPVLVFLSLVFWGWLWGIGGALLAVPLLAIIRIWCGHFESTKRFAAMLGD